MNSDDDDEALTWAGGRDPSHYETPGEKAAQRARAPKDARPNRNEPAAAEEALEPATAAGAVTLVSLGVLGGVYLLYTVGWFISLQRFSYASTDALELGAFHAQQVLAILGPPLWFGLSVAFTRERRAILRLLWLLAGALVFVPWPFVFGS